MKIPQNGMLYVTTPIDSFGNRTLAILSSMGPERTTIVGVDKNLHVELLYDSFQEKPRQYLGSGISRIDSVHVKTAGILFLQEISARNGERNGPPRMGRGYVIDVTSGKFKISRTDIRRDR